MWSVRVHDKARKAMLRLPSPVVKAFEALLFDLRARGPVAGNWPNYGKLDRQRHHCHLRKGRPTYVAVWWEVREEDHSIEVTYVGTHEKAPY